MEIQTKNLFKEIIDNNNTNLNLKSKTWGTSHHPY